MRMPRPYLALLSAGLLAAAACQPAAQPTPTTAPAKPAAAASPAAPAASPAASPAAKPAAPAASPVAAASPAAKPAASPAASPAAKPVASPAAAALETGCPNRPAAAGAKRLRVGLVTDVGKVDDKSFNQSAWEGVQCAQRNGWATDVKFIETTDPKDYAKNVETFAQDNYEVIVTVGFALGEATTAAARKYPNIKFVGVDQAQGDTVANLAGLIFPEDKAGYLAGMLAGLMTKSNSVGQVLGTPVVPPVEAFGVGFISGAKAARSGIKILSACHPGGLARGFTDPEWGKDTANLQINQGADVIFTAGGQTGNGGLLAIAEKRGTVLGIGVDTDQYLTLPEARPILLSSAMKLITPGVFNLITAAHGGTFKGGNTLGDVALAPYHDLESRVPADVKQRIDQATAEVRAGSARTGWDKPSGNCPQP